MATSPAGKKPAPRKTVAKPAATDKKAAGKAAPVKAKTPAKRAPAKTVKVIKKVSEQDTPQLGLSAKQQKFVDEYLVDLNGTQAAIRAGYSPNTARFIGHENLTKPYIQLAIAAARRQQQERTGITADRVVMEAWNIVTADARELVGVKVGCCRCCYGEGFKFQRTVAELNFDRDAWLTKGNAVEEFDLQGGIGYSPLRSPHAECPECGGDGAARVVLQDTRSLTPQALALYAGAKEGKHGIEIQMHDKSAAMEKLFKHLGLYERDNEQKVDPLATILARIANGNGNGFRPVLDDPEAPRAAGTNSLLPRENDDDGADDALA